MIFRLAPSESEVTRLEASWTPPEEHEPTGGVTLDFERPPPEMVRHRMKAPNGEYEVRVEVTKRGPGGRPTKTSWARRVTLSGQHATLWLDDAHP